VNSAARDPYLAAIGRDVNASGFGFKRDYLSLARGAFDSAYAFAFQVRL
jgi:hypothetical protein